MSLGGKSYDKGLTIKCSLDREYVSEALEMVSFLKENGIDNVTIVAKKEFGAPEIRLKTHELTIIGLSQLKKHLKEIKEFNQYREAVALMY